jgi:hypothetical protein
MSQSRPDTGPAQGGALNRGDFTAYRRLVWLAAHPDATSAELAQAFKSLSEDAARKFLDGMARRRVVERRVVYRVRDDVR